MCHRRGGERGGEAYLVVLFGTAPNRNADRRKTRARAARVGVSCGESSCSY